VKILPLSAGEAERVVAAGLGLARRPRDDGSFYLIAWEDGEPVGHAYLALDDPPELQDVEVLPTHRRRGVASALTQAAENEVRAATLFVSDGTRMPNFTQTSPRPVSHGCGHYCYRGMRKGFAQPMKR